MRKCFVFIAIALQIFFLSSCDFLKSSVEIWKNVAKQPAESIKPVTLHGINSIEITEGGVDLQMPDEEKTLYTITINYPTGEYTGLEKASFSIEASGFQENSNIVNKNIASRAVPEQGGAWDLFDYNSQKVRGTHWFTDEENKINFYYTPKGRKDCYTTQETWEHWDKLKQAFMSDDCKLNEQNMLKVEREVFGISEYDKDKTPYFYVIFDDFGDESVQFSGTQFMGGIAGVYMSTHLRDYYRSNKADCFYVNSRYVQAEYEYAPNKPTFIQIVNEITETLCHEYVHYLMDSCTLKNYDESTKIDIPVIYSNSTVNDFKNYAKAYMADGISSISLGNLVWIEGTAQYAPYKLFGLADSISMRFWIRDMYKWRPAINRYDDFEQHKEDTYLWLNPAGAANAGNEQAVYGIGGLFVSYIAEKYGDDVIKKLYQYSENPHEVMSVIENKCPVENYNIYGEIGQDNFFLLKGDYDKYRLDCLRQSGDINRIIKNVLGIEFKDVWLNFMLQIFSSLSDSSCIEGCIEDFSCSKDWGFTKTILDSNVNANFVVNGNTFSHENLPELSIVINKWDNNPTHLKLEKTKGNVKSYAMWI